MKGVNLHFNLHFRLHEASVPAKIRRVSSSTIATPTLPTTSTIATAASMMASTSRGGLTAATPSAQRLPTNSNVAVPARRVPVNGITAGESQPLTGVQQQQQPTILHRRVHHPSSLLRRNQQMWGQEKSSPSFSAANTNSAAFYATSSASAATSVLPPPSTSVMTKMARDAGHLSGVSEVQVGLLRSLLPCLALIIFIATLLFSFLELKRRCNSCLFEASNDATFDGTHLNHLFNRSTS